MFSLDEKKEMTNDGIIVNTKRMEFDIIRPTNDVLALVSRLVKRVALPDLECSHCFRFSGNARGRRMGSALIDYSVY